MSKHNSRDQIGKSIDGILGGLTIRGRSENKEEEIVKLQNKLAQYEAELGALDHLKKEKEELFQEVSKLKKEQVDFARNIEWLQSKLSKMENDKKVLEEKQITLDHLIKKQEYERSQLFKEVEVLHKKKEEFTEELKESKTQVSTNKNPYIEIRQSIYEKDQLAYRPSQLVRQYCEQSEGKRKLTIHLREIEYQAILKASQNMNGHKGRLMDTITKALRFYIPDHHYQEAEQEVYQKAIHSVRGFLEKMGFSPEDIEKKSTSIYEEK